MATVLLGSIATFPSYAEDNTLDASEQNNLQNPEIKKIIELLSGFLPTLQEAEAAPNENAIKAKNLRLVELMGQLSSTTLEMNLVKGELAVLAHNPSSNSKKVQEIQNKLASPMNNLLVIAEEMGNEIDELTELINEKTQEDEEEVILLNNDLVALEAQTAAEEQGASNLKSSVNTFVADVEEKKEKLKNEADEVMEFADVVLSTISASPSEDIVDDPAFLNMLDELEDLEDAGDELEVLDEMQNVLIDEANSLESQIRGTQIQSKQISSGASQVTGSLSGLDDSITIAHNAVLMQENALNALALTISTTSKGIPSQIQDLQNQINILRMQIVDLQGQINELAIKVNRIQSQVSDLTKGVADLDVRTTMVESEVDVLQQQMSDLLEVNVFQKLAKTFGVLAGVAAVGAALACAFLDVGACAGFSFFAAGLALMAGIYSALA